MAAIAGSVRFYPGSLWSSTMGIGIGLGYEFKGITGGTSSLLLVAKPSIHRGIYEVSYVTRDPYLGTPYLGAAVYYQDTGRTRYYGLGPFSSPDGRVFVEDRFLRLRIRGGVPVDGGRWLIQPVGEFISVHVDTFRNDDADAFARLSPESRDALILSEAEATVQWASAGIEGGLYFARDPTRSGSGIQAILARVQSLTNGGDGFWRAGAMVLMDEALGTRHFFGRIAFETVLGPSDDVPYYLLPRLGGRLLPGIARHRFRGTSMLAVKAGVEQPLFNVYGYAGVDLVLMAGVGSVYDEISAQFTPRISFEKTISPGGRAPLRPAGGAGFRFYVGDRPLELTVVAGLSADRLSIVTFRLRRDIRHRQGLFRR